MTSEYVPGNRKTLVISLGVVIAILLLPFIVEPIVEYLMGYDPSLFEHNLSRALKQEWLKATLVVGSLNIVYAILGVEAILIGVKSINARRFPPPGMPMPFRTKVQKGKMAIVSGIVWCVVGCTSLFRAASFVIFWPWKLL
ncbi:MAG: hypothetical protein ACYC9H_13690 [Sulfuricaulis sp.]